MRHLTPSFSFPDFFSLQSPLIKSIAQLTMEALLREAQNTNANLETLGNAIVNQLQVIKESSERRYYIPEYLEASNIHEDLVSQIWNTAWMMLWVDADTILDEIANVCGITKGGDESGNQNAPIMYSSDTMGDEIKKILNAHLNPRLSLSIQFSPEFCKMMFEFSKKRVTNKKIIDSYCLLLFSDLCFEVKIRPKAWEVDFRPYLEDLIFLRMGDNTPFEPNRFCLIACEFNLTTVLNILLKKSVNYQSLLNYCYGDQSALINSSRHGSYDCLKIVLSKWEKLLRAFLENNASPLEVSPFHDQIWHALLFAKDADTLSILLPSCVTLLLLSSGKQPDTFDGKFSDIFYDQSSRIEYSSPLNSLYDLFAKIYAVQDNIEIKKTLLAFLKDDSRSGLSCAADYTAFQEKVCSFVGNKESCVLDSFIEELKKTEEAETQTTRLSFK